MPAPRDDVLYLRRVSELSPRRSAPRLPRARDDPRSGLDVGRSLLCPAELLPRVEGDVIVVELRLSCNLHECAA